MEHIGEILKQVRTNSANKNTETLSSAELPAGNQDGEPQAVNSGAEPEDASPDSDCPVCRGAKFVHPLLLSGKPDYSHVIPCRCSQQVADKRKSSLGSLARFNFANLIPQGKSTNSANQEQFNRAYQAARAFAEKPEVWLVLSGPSGCGKTHLAVAIANHCIENSRPVSYISTPDLLDHLRSTFSPNSETPYDELFEQVRDTPLLILDDLGAQSSTPWAKEKLEQLINHRFSNQLPTVIVSILPLDELDERIRTRLLASNHYQLCSFDEKSARELSLSWGPQFSKQKEMTFDNFDWKQAKLEYRENLMAAHQLAQEFAKSPDGWLVFQGGNGCGKTHLAAAIVNYRYANKEPAMFVVVPDFLDHLRASFSPDSKISYDQVFENVKNAPLLILDDFGKQTTTPWAQEKLYQVINYRYNAQLPTVITTNCSTDELDAAISSRFADLKICNFFHITAPHYSSGQVSLKRAPRGGQRGR